MSFDMRRNFDELVLMAGFVPCIGRSRCRLYNPIWAQVPGWPCGRAPTETPLLGYSMIDPN
jgi:hypothetical protein